MARKRMKMQDLERATHAAAPPRARGAPRLLAWVAGKVDAVRMAESGVQLVNRIIGLIRKATILRFVAAVSEDHAARAPRSLAPVHRAE